MVRVLELIPVRRGDFGVALAFMGPSAFELFTHFEGYFEFARTIQLIVDRWQYYTQEIWVTLFDALKRALERLGVDPQFPLEPHHFDLMTLAVIFSGTAVGIYWRQSNRGQTISNLFDAAGVTFGDDLGLVGSLTDQLKFTVAIFMAFSPIVLIAIILLGIGSDSSELRPIPLDLIDIRDPIGLFAGVAEELRNLIAGNTFSSILIAMFFGGLAALFFMSLIPGIVIGQFLGIKLPAPFNPDWVPESFVLFVFFLIIVGLGFGIYGPDDLSTLSDLIFFLALYPLCLFLIFLLPILHWRSGYLLMLNAGIIWGVNVLLIEYEPAIYEFIQNL